METTEKIDADELIAYLGGPTKAGALLGISKSAISQWRVNGVPKMQEKCLRLTHPGAFNAATKKRLPTPP